MKPSLSSPPTRWISRFSRLKSLRMLPATSTGPPSRELGLEWKSKVSRRASSGSFWCYSSKSTIIKGQSIKGHIFYRNQIERV